MALVLNGILPQQGPLFAVTIPVLRGIAINIPAAQRPGLRKQQIIDIILAHVPPPPPPPPPLAPGVNAAEAAAWMLAAGNARSVDYTSIPMLWGDARVLLDPFLWVLMLRVAPLVEADFIDAQGFEGPFLERVRKGWAAALPGCSDVVLKDLSDSLYDVRCRLLTCAAGTPPAEFFQRHTLRLKGILNVLIKSQLGKVQDAGFAKVASAVLAKTVLCDASLMTLGLGAELAKQKFTGTLMDDSDDDEHQTRRHRKRNRSWGAGAGSTGGAGNKCSKCKTVVVGPFKAHNLVCLARKKTDATKTGSK